MSKSPYMMDVVASKSHDGGWTSKARINDQSAGKIKRSDTVKKLKKVKSLHCNLLATHEPSKFVFRCPPGLQSNLLKILLKNE